MCLPLKIIWRNDMWLVHHWLMLHDPTCDAFEEFVGALFHKGIPRKGNKCTPWTILKSNVAILTEPYLKPTLSLRVCIWFKLFQVLVMIYISMCVLHMCEKYGHHASIVFYGYDSSNLTKGVEQRQHGVQATAGNFLFNLDQLRQTHERSSFFNKQWKWI